MVGRFEEQHRDDIEKQHFPDISQYQSIGEWSYCPGLPTIAIMCWNYLCIDVYFDEKEFIFLDLLISPTKSPHHPTILRPRYIINYIKSKQPLHMITDYQN